MIAGSGSALDVAGFRRRMVRVLIPAAVAISIVVVMFRILAVRLGAVREVGLDAVSAIALLPAIAIVLDTARQWRTHVEVSKAVYAHRGSKRCGSCGAGAAARDPFGEA